jgi:predicted Zn-dependent protease
MSIKQSRVDIPRLEEAHSNNPRDFNLVFQLVQAYAKAGQNDRLAPLLQGYLAQTNISPDDMLQVAQLYMNLSQPDSAVDTLRVSTQRFPNDGRSYYSIAMIRASQNNAAEVLPMLARAIQLTPEFRAKAATEQVFGNLRGNPQFQQLINSQ